jgi:DNA-binding CsgD family transcriptional regulator
MTRPASSRHLEIIEPGKVAELHRRAVALRKVQQCIRDLREITSTADLIEAAPAAVCKLGFDRAMISRIEDSTWVIERFFSELDPAWAAKLTAAVRESPQRLGPAMIETEIVRRKAAVIVTDAQANRRVNRVLAEATMSDSYVAAPIMPDGRVIGFLHADRYSTGSVMDEFDRDLISTFAEQFGQILERTVLLQRVKELRASIGNLTQALTGSVNGCLENNVDMAPPGRSQPSYSVANISVAKLEPAFQGASLLPGSVLTRREVDVLRLMANGDTNSRIASRLIISEGTVKSHVKHILRKLGAANRAEAVCRWLRDERDARPGAPPEDIRTASRG